MRTTSSPIQWLDADDVFPDIESAWIDGDPAPGLLAAGGSLQVGTLLQAYSKGIFPWFSEGQPILWWSPDPRMVLEVEKFKLHRSLRQSLRRFVADPSCEIRFDSAFERVIRECANSPRDGQSGTWIVPKMQEAYIALHRAGHAHSVEVWVSGELAGGLYCVNIGGAVFGESMFTNQTDASKIALSALVAFCKARGIEMIDCQQNTRHLASLGAREIPRQSFALAVGKSIAKSAPTWEFDLVYWDEIWRQFGKQLPAP
jgi:leucyl/phenylalanyl-tRNA---protein transferase